MTVGRQRKKKNMSLLIEDLSRDRMRRVQHDAEVGRAAELRRRELRRVRAAARK